MISDKETLMTIEMFAELEMERFGTDPEKWETPYAKFVSKVYEMAHTAVSPKCRSNHPTWTGNLIKLHRNYVEHDLIPENENER